MIWYSSWHGRWSSAGVLLKLSGSRLNVGRETVWASRSLRMVPR